MAGFERKIYMNNELKWGIEAYKDEAIMFGANVVYISRNNDFHLYLIFNFWKWILVVGRISA